MEAHGFKVVTDDGALQAAVQEALDANPDVVEKLKGGNMKPMGAIIGAVMRATKGQADAKAVTKIVMEKIKGCARVRVTACLCACRGRAPGQAHLFFRRISSVCSTTS